MKAIKGVIGISLWRYMDVNGLSNTYDMRRTTELKPEDTPPIIGEIHEESGYMGVIFDLEALLFDMYGNDSGKIRNV